MSELKKEYVIDNVRLMGEWDLEKNIDFDPNKLTVGSNKKVWWKCAKGHSWNMSIYKKVKSRGCPFCLNKRVLIGFNDLGTLFPNLVKEWDFEKNQIDINSIVIGSAKKVSWICLRCQHQWDATVRMRTQREQGCPKCAKVTSAQNRIKTYVTNNGCITCPTLLKEWNYEKNEKNELFPEKLTLHSNKKVWWKCSKCSYEWQTTISNRSYRGDSCPLCSNRVVVDGINDLATTHPFLAKEWDYEENGDLVPQNVSYGMGKKVGWICPIGHKYKATILHRSSGTNCPICNSGRQTSFAEQAIFHYIKQLYPNTVNRYKDIFDNGMEIDIYIPELRYAIEYDGSYWHQENKFEREKRKYEICKQNKIKLIRIKAQEEADSIKTHYADYTLFLKEESESELEKLIQNLYYKLIALNDFTSHPFSKWKRVMSTVNIERDRYKILNYRYIQKNSFADDHPELVLEWHPTKNENLNPNMFKSGSSFRAWWLCGTCGHEWQASIYHRAKGSRCDKCVRRNNSGKNHYKAKRIYQYSPEGAFILEWGSVSDASKTLKINQSNISMCAEGKRNIAGGYRWTHDFFEKLPPVERKQISRKGEHGKSVVQLDLQGKIVNRFISLNEAAEKTGINSTSISKVINGHIKTAGGYFWKVDK